MRPAKALVRLCIYIDSSEPYSCAIKWYMYVPKSYILFVVLALIVFEYLSDASNEHFKYVSLHYARLRQSGRNFNSSVFNILNKRPQFIPTQPSTLHYTDGIFKENLL